ncbi:hypothetical protein BWK69_01350 [Candidatus Parcubacteria bacterium A4]|nr:MAG: hypothetical protein BWK69_01350 [Candidatus Parcubacteria bacterium A4]
MEKNDIKISKSFYNSGSIKIKEPLFIFRNISKSFFGKELFHDVVMSMSDGERIAVVGANGTGKSTILKIIIGLKESDQGSVERNRELKIGYLPQETHWDSLKNAIFQEVCSVKPEMQREITYLLKDFGFPEKSWERKISSLSGGEKTKLALLKLLILKPNLLILDEPTNHLDLQTIEWLEDFLVSWKRGIICVSHDKYFLDKVCDKTFELSNNGFEKYYCSYSQYLEERAVRLENKDLNYNRQEKYLKKQQEFIDRFRAKASTAKRVQSKIKQIKKMELAEKLETNKDIKIRLDSETKVCSKVMEINDLLVGAEESPLFVVSEKLEVRWGDKIGIVGRNGSGKSTFLKMILRSQEDNIREIKLNDRIKLGYYAQGHEELDPKKNILEEVTSKATVEEEKIRNVLGGLLFSGKDVFKKIGSLSGGERARVALAELILSGKPNLFLLDEPTNHLDLPSKEIINKLFKEFSGTVILISHDRHILNNVCNIIWEVKGGAIKEYLGNYDDYRRSIAK